MVRALVATVIALAGCGSYIRDQAATSTYRILQQSTIASRRVADVELARAAMPAGIIQLDAFALAYPDHREFRVLQAETVCQYATAFVFDDWEAAQLANRPDEAEALAARLGPLLETCVARNVALLPPAWRDAVAAGGDALAAQLPRAARAEVPALLWIATAKAVRVALAPMQHLAELPDALGMLARCVALAPGFHDADAELMLGTLEAARSQFLRGDDGHARFEAARRAQGPGDLLVDVMEARAIAVARRDRAAFEAALHRVLEADPHRWPERRLRNELARRKAARYLAAEDVLIPPTAAAPRGGT